MGFNNLRDNGHTNSETLTLSETFYINNRKNTVFNVSLSNKGFCLEKCSGGIVKEQIIQINDIIGSRCMRSKNKIRGNVRPCACSSPNMDKNKIVLSEDTNIIQNENWDPSAYLYIYAYILKKKLRSHMRRERTVITLRFRSFDKYEDNIREAHKWQGVIKQLKHVEPTNSVNQGKILVILNPKSGAGKARELFHQEVVPIFVEAEIFYDLFVTKYANYAMELVRSKDIHNWSCILVVGGDGIFFEVINGLMQRQDWKHVFHKIAIGIVPCGSGNGLAKSISFSYNEPYEPNPILGAALTAVRGKTALMDLVRVETRTQIMFSFLSIGWGLISDIDIESERLRSLGYQRFALWSVHRLISLRTYYGKLSYFPRSHESDINVEHSPCNSSDLLRHSLSMDTCLEKSQNIGFPENAESNEFGDVISLETSLNKDEFRQRVDSWYSATSRKSTYFSIADSLYQSIGDQGIENSKGGSCPNISQTFGPSPNTPSLMTPVPSSWKTEEGEYVMIHAAYQSHLGMDCFFAPSAKLNDGIIWLVVIRGGVSRSQLLTFLLNMSSGTHIPTKNNEFIRIIPVSAFRIEPTGTGGIITVDGERVEYGSIQGEIFPGLVNVMVPK